MERVPRRCAWFELQLTCLWLCPRLFSYTLAPLTTLSRAYKLFRGLGLRHLCLIDDCNNVVGMLTRAEFTSHRLERLMHDLSARQKLNPTGNRRQGRTMYFGGRSDDASSVIPRPGKYEMPAPPGRGVAIPLSEGVSECVYEDDPLLDGSDNPTLY